MGKVIASVMVRPGKIELREFEKPGANKDEILLKVEQTGVCGTDWHIYLGHLPLKFPVIPGHEIIGRIEEIGENANDVMSIVGGPLTKGDRVAVVPSSKGCGKCYYCLNVPHKPQLCPNRTVYGTMNCEDPPYLKGGFAEYMHVHSKSWVFKVGENLPLDRATLVEPMSFATRVVNRAIEPGIPNIGEGYGFGKKVVVQGAGPIGLLIIAVFKFTGPARIIVLDFLDSRLEMAKRMGADFTIDAKEFDHHARIQKVLDLTEGVGADVVVEATGSPSAFTESIDYVRRGGKIIEAGHYTDAGETKINPHIVCRKDVDIHGCWANAPIQFKDGLILLEKSSSPLEDLITHKFSLDKVEQAINMFGKEGVYKMVITP